MRITISGKNIDVTQGLKDAVYEKLGKLEKYFTPETEAIVTLSVEKNRQKIEVTVPVKGSVIRAEQVSDDMYVSIDLVQEIIERQMRKHKTRLVNRNRGGGNFQKAFIEMLQTLIKRSKFYPYRRSVTSLCTVLERCIIGVPHMPWIIPLY